MGLGWSARRQKGDNAEHMFYIRTKHLNKEAVNAADWLRSNDGSLAAAAVAAERVSWVMVVFVESCARLKMLFMRNLQGSSVQWVHSGGVSGGGLLCREGLKVTASLFATPSSKAGEGFVVSSNTMPSTIVQHGELRR